MTEGSLHLRSSQPGKAKVEVSAAARSVNAQASQMGKALHLWAWACAFTNFHFLHTCTVAHFFHPLPIIKSSEPTLLYPLTDSLLQTTELSRPNVVYQAHKRNASDGPSRRHVGHRIFCPLFTGRLVSQCTHYISFFNINLIIFFVTQF